MSLPSGTSWVSEYVDDGHSGARLDRPGLDALRDAAEAGLVERVWCLSPDRLARAYAYQVLVLDELERFGVTVAFTDAPGLAADDPQAVLLTQVQGVIAEYEKAKIAERYRRGKLFRARAGEIVTWKTSYGYRRIPRSAATGQAHLRNLRTRGRRGATHLHRPRCRHHDRAKSVAASTPKPSRHQPANPPGATPPSAGCCATKPTSAASTTTAPNQCPTAAPPMATGRCPVTARTGSRSTARESFPTSCSRPPPASPPITPSGARAAPNPASGCSKDSSNAAFAESAPTATRCAAATAPGTVTTTAATTTPCAPAANNIAARNATSAPTPWTPSSSITSAR